MIGKALATFKKSSSQWNTVAGSSSVPLRAADLPVKEEPVDPDDPTASAVAAPPKAATKRKGGLRTAAQVAEDAAAALAAREPSPEVEGGPDPTATIHRDASGRVMDVEALKAEAKRAEEEEKRKEREREEWGKGITQRRDREERARLEKEMSTKKVERLVTVHFAS